MKLTIRKYHSEGRAQPTIRKLRDKFPHITFDVVQHPRDFGFAIVARYAAGNKAYVTKGVLGSPNRWQG